MLRAALFFSISAVLSIITLFSKSEHSFDYKLIAPAGLYFLLAFLLAFRPKVGWVSIAQFTGLSLLVWIVFYSLSYNLLFLFIAPISGGIGAWLVSLMSQQLLQLSLKKYRPIIITGVATTFIGVLFMIAVKNLPKETFTIGLKVGVITALWQLGVGLQIARMLLPQPADQTA